MAALPAPLDPAVPPVSLAPPLPSSEEPRPVRPRFRRLVVFTGRIS